MIVTEAENTQKEPNSDILIQPQLISIPEFQIGDHQDSEIKSFYPDGTERSDAAYQIQKSKKASTKQDSSDTPSARPPKPSQPSPSSLRQRGRRQRQCGSNMRGGSEDETSQSILAKTLRLVVRTKTKTKNHQNKKTHKIHTSSSIPPYPKAPPIGDDEGDGGCAGGWDGVLLALLSFTRWISSQLRLFLYLLNIPRSRPIIPNSKAYPRVS
ncbi:hypothetical protein C8J56DRAFT_896612 [Mycena floridula]|nr:hypothetical protein C8J56DRAFT_896612 [Mycena floridula]